MCIASAVLALTRGEGSLKSNVSAVCVHEHGRVCVLLHTTCIMYMLHHCTTCVCNTVEPLNNGHIGGRDFVPCRELGCPLLEVNNFLTYNKSNNHISMVK